MRRTFTLAVLAIVLMTLAQPAMAGDRPHLVTRAEFVQMLLQGDGIAAGSDCGGTFKDVPCSDPAAPAIETAYRLAIVTGYAGGQFHPSALVSRQEMIVMVERSRARTLMLDKLPQARVATALSRFADSAQIASWARGAVAVAAAEGVVRGLPDGRFDAQATATRVQAAIAVARSLPVRGARAANGTVDGRQVRYSRALTVRTTAYAAGEVGVGSMTASGLPVRLGSVSVDPSVIPLGTLLYVEGYGYAIACDTGGAIRGNHVDLYLGSAERAKQYGVQTRSVYIVDTPSPATVLAGV